MMLSLIDWVIILIVAFSTFISLWRGASREIFSLITWIVAAFVSFKYAGHLEGLFMTMTESHVLRYAVAFFLLFVIILIIGGVFSSMMDRLVSFAGLKFLDALLGLVFGFARGVLIIAIAVALLQYTTIPHDKWWKESHLIPRFENLASTITKWIEANHFSSPAIDDIKQSLKNEHSDKKSEPAPSPAT